MCGFCGYVHADEGFRPDEKTLGRMRDTLKHRGPDDAGLFVGPGVGLGSRRLAIQDLSSAGHMPMWSASGRCVIAYNGEVYNFRELRQELAQSGYPFRSHTDTEVLVALFERHGPGMLDRLNGMFAFAIWDTTTRSLFIARDRLGVKPAYYAIKDGALWFASEEKALFAAGIEPTFDQHTWTELLCFRYVAGPRTPFHGVHRLLPGHWLKWERGSIQVRRWWTLADRVSADAQPRETDFAGWFERTFDSAIDYRRISDVPVGVLLSGGLDSSSVAVSLARQAGQGVASFTVRFSDRSHDEGPLAKIVAQQAGLDYHELIVKEEDLLGELGRASELNDEPLVHGNDLHILAISRFAKPLVTVLLSGEGADETLGGYVRYRPLVHHRLLSGSSLPLQAASAMLPFAPPRVHKLARFLKLGSIDAFVLFNASDLLPHELERIGMTVDTSFEYRRQIFDEAKRVYPFEPVRQAMYSDQHTFLSSILDRNDRMTMGASIECRVPFLDYRLVEGLANIPTGRLISGRQGKLLMRRAFASRLPEEILRHQKWGFAVPWERYFRREPILRDFVHGLPDREPVLSGPFDRPRLRQVVDRFLSGDEAHESLIRQLVMVTVWHERVCRVFSPAS